MLNRFTKSILVTVAVALLSASFVSLPSLALGDYPEATLKVPVLVPEESVSTYIPSEAAPGLGIAVNIVYPEKIRYPDGAPVAVIAPGGSEADGLTFTMHASQVGFVEVRMAFPGGGKSKFHSGGIYDYRGTQSQLALRDVLLFAGGKIADTRGHYISDLVPVKIEKTNVGLVGWSNGGNIAMITLGKYPEDLKSIVSWVAFYESPIGAMFFPPNLGGAKDLLFNKHYRQGSAAAGACVVDWKKLVWAASTIRNQGEHKKLGEPEIPGLLYFDENKNGNWDESVEFALTYALDVALEKQIYQPEVLNALLIMKMFDRDIEDKPDPSNETKRREPPPKPLKKGEKPPPPKPKKMKHIIAWPSTLATLQESEAYFAERDGSAYYGKIAAEYPFLMITILATYVDHLQRQPDHPHIAMQYNAWLAHKAHWVRMNPEASYLAMITGMNIENFTNNRPNAPIDASSIANYLEQEGTTKDYVFMDAAIAELADRRRAKSATFPLPIPITTYYNRLNPPPPPVVPKTQEGQTKPASKAEPKPDAKPAKKPDPTADPKSEQ
jgi:hypothetical protein